MKSNGVMCVYVYVCEYTYICVYTWRTVSIMLDSIASACLPSMASNFLRVILPQEATRELYRDDAEKVFSPWLKRMGCLARWVWPPRSEEHISFLNQKCTSDCEKKYQCESNSQRSEHAVTSPSLKPAICMHINNNENKCTSQWNCNLAWSLLTITYCEILLWICDMYTEYNEVLEISASDWERRKNYQPNLQSLLSSNNTVMSCKTYSAHALKKKRFHRRMDVGRIYM